MISQQVFGTLLIFIVCPILGGLPLTDWFFYLVKKKKLSQIGTGNVSVSAAFYHGGRFMGIVAVLTEASKGIVAVLLARRFFVGDPKWELLALLALVIGRYWFSQGAGITNLVWGIVLHDWRVAILTLMISGIGFTLVRERQAARMFSLFIFGLLLVLLHAGDDGYILSAVFLVCLIWLIYQKIPDDLNLSVQGVHEDSQKIFKFFRADRSLLSLEDRLDAQKVGSKAANLSFLKRSGYSIPQGWVLPGGEDLEQIVEFFNPTEQEPLVVRSSAIGEDSKTSSAAGQYLSILNITSRSKLLEAIIDCRESYHSQGQVYRQSHGSSSDHDLAIIVQKQIRGIYSGVVFSRDPVDSLNPSVIIEALPGQADQVVSGRVIPQRYQVDLTEPIVTNSSQDATIALDLIIEVAKLSRELEALWHGLPQDLEWTYDGEQLWLLQARPITTLLPIWTRRIAAEVIPGIIRPLTWSINLPLTCGVWSEIFQIVLGKGSINDLDFQQMATLHYQRAYFNATFLGEIFRKMGLPPESLDFLIRGTKFTKPSLASTLKNSPGLVRLLVTELNLEHKWKKNHQKTLEPLLSKLDNIALGSLGEDKLLEMIEEVLNALRIATYYSILAPLSLAMRTKIFNVDLANLDNSQNPEVAAFYDLSQIGETEDIGTWLAKYGYLSEVATDIAVPRWQEEPTKLLAMLQSSKEKRQKIRSISYSYSHPVQRRLNLKGQVSIVYSKLLAHLRWCFLALEQIYLSNRTLEQEGDIFFLEYKEIIDIKQNIQLKEIITSRKQQWLDNQANSRVPSVIYGKAYPLKFEQVARDAIYLYGIPVSGGEAIGTIRICQTIEEAITFSSDDNILVVPYTDSGWVPLLALAKGLICEVGGVLSHGAIIAREYGIPAVMDIESVTTRLRNGQKVLLNGYTGCITILSDQDPKR